ncbi:MAG TPA: choline kinase family protein [Candidatus Limnocylindrales bacterium]|nr:choline kinase family protein [Candidatus Limnocylindrales bacterium]
MGPTIDEIVASIEAWRGCTVTVEPLAGGLTNQNWAVTVDGRRHFVRLPGANTGLLAVDRANELHNTRAAATTGVGALVVDALPEHGVIVLDWIDGVTMSNERFAADGMPERVAASLRRLHAGPRFLHDFDMFRLVEFYLRVVDERGITVPAGYRDGIARIPAIEAALAVRPLAPVPSHNDLLAENYLDDGAALRIVDYEYSGNNDPTFELGNTCQELGWDDARIEALCAAYFGSATEHLVARMRLQMIMSDVGWTLWAAIQAAISTIDFDFWGWAEERWARAAAKLDSPDLARWVAAVGGS